MPFKPLISGESTVEISSSEYFNLAKKAERIAAVERFINASEFVTVKDIMALLDIKKEERKTEK